MLVLLNVYIMIPLLYLLFMFLHCPSFLLSLLYSFLFHSLISLPSHSTFTTFLPSSLFPSYELSLYLLHIHYPLTNILPAFLTPSFFSYSSSHSLPSFPLSFSPLHSYLVPSSPTIFPPFLSPPLPSLRLLSPLLSLFLPP